MINSRDYNSDQISVWASASGNVERWQGKIADQHFFLAETDATIVGFASMANDGYVDMFYVHYLHQGKSIGTLLIKTLEELAAGFSLKEIRADVSITAKPFFEKHGFKMIKLQHKEVSGISFVNFLMTKQLLSETA